MLLLSVAVATVALAVPGGHCSPPKEISIGHCPDYFPKQDFVLSSYLGLWYEHQRFDNGFEMGLDCAKAEYTDLGDGFFELHNSGRKEGDLFAESFAVGYELAPGHIVADFEGHDPVNYFVLDTDYETFAAVYNCVQLGEVMYEYAWMFTRQTSVSEDLIAKIRQVFVENGVDVNLFQVTNQGPDCVYIP
ncbi:crustacyanin-A2 subunit-like [Penaeus chinensis]|uniref:crustacyanin-A2 subunit-like n=1 Tax=Penaeus chinensis TaxID=139456 RepID=UPI001FB737B9|nr:crustacyanin-A2 subunit-like [Penaeus chinensis]XP_047471144.1 crustacyanin-A2 subunit-like [Penaeus chinensis]